MGVGCRGAKYIPYCALYLLRQNMGYPSGTDRHLVGISVAAFIPVHHYLFTPDGDLGMMVTHRVLNWCSCSTVAVN